MKQRQDYVIYDSNDIEGTVEQTLNVLHDNGHEDATADNVLVKYPSWYYDTEVSNWQDMLEYIGGFYPDGMVVCISNRTDYHGTRATSWVFDGQSFDEVLDKICDGDGSFEIGISHDHNTLYCRCAQNNSWWSDTYLFHVLTPQGCSAVERSEYPIGNVDYHQSFVGMSDREMHDRLWNSHYYSRPIVPNGFKRN